MSLQKSAIRLNNFVEFPIAPLLSRAFLNDCFDVGKFAVTLLIFAFLPYVLRLSEFAWSMIWDNAELGGYTR